MDGSRLPTLVLSEIFNFLTIYEKNRAKQVCKLWKYVIEQTIQRRLCLYGKLWAKPFHARWDDCLEAPVSELDKFSVLQKHYNVDKSCNYLSRLINVLVSRKEDLKKIYLYRCCSCSRFLKSIQDFKRLEELVLEKVDKVWINKLSSSSLLTISFKEVCSFSNWPLYLETPNLTKFIFFNYTTNSYDTFQRVLPSYPERIVYLKCKILPNSFTNLKSLVHLICQDIGDNVDFSNYPKLKKLEYYPEKSDRALARIENLKEHRRKFSPDLAIFVSGFKLDSAFFASPIFFNWTGNFLFFIEKDDLALFSRNFSRLTNQFPWRIAVDYLALFDSFAGRIPERFLKIFPDVGSVIVNGAAYLEPSQEIDSHKLIDFLNQCRSLKILKLLKLPGLGPDFYWRLSTMSSTSSITRLEISQSEVVEFEIARFRNLKELELTSRRLSLKMVNLALEKDQFFFEFYFNFNDENSDLKIQLSRLDAYIYSKPNHLYVYKGYECISHNTIHNSIEAIDILRGNEQTKNYLV